MSKQEVWKELFKQGADIGAQFPVLYCDTRVGMVTPKTGTWVSWAEQRNRWDAQVGILADESITHFGPNSPDWIILCGELRHLLKIASLDMPEDVFEHWYESYKDVQANAGMLG